MVKPKKLTSAGYILNEATNHRRVTFLNELIGLAGRMDNVDNQRQIGSREDYFLTAFDDDAALLAAVPGNAALFLDQFLELVLL